jgi:hypothetical protein
MYGTLSRVGEESERILVNLSAIDAQRIVTNIDMVPKFCDRVNLIWNPKRGYYTFAFFMVEIGIAFKALAKTIRLLLNREESVAVSNG